MNETICPECGAHGSDGETCQDRFYVFGFWELDYKLNDVHHLMVPCYYVQHPRLYSAQGLAHAKRLLVQFVDEGLTPQEARRQIQNSVDWEMRKFKITGTPELHGGYAQPVQWTLTTSDVIAGGIERYYERIYDWAQSILASLRKSGNLADASLL